MNRAACLATILGIFATLGAPPGNAQTVTRWTDPKPYGLFFNDYDPNFYTGFVPRVQRAERIKVHIARGNQLRVRMVLPDEAIDNYLPDQVARHDLYQEVIEKGVISLTSNSAWEEYDQRFQAEVPTWRAGSNRILSVRHPSGRLRENVG